MTSKPICNTRVSELPTSPFGRREFLVRGARSVAATCWPLPLMAQRPDGLRFKAVALDAFPIFDPRPVFLLAEASFPGKGAALANAWRTRQFEYQWLHSLAGRYVDFWQATEDALVFAAKQVQVPLSTEKRATLMQAYLQLQTWRDVIPALRSLQHAGIRLAFLSNMTERMLETGIRTAGLAGIFEHVLSTDQAKTCKPDPRAYQLAIDAFGVPREEILFAAFAGWDAAGAKWFGYPTFWVNRLDIPTEELGIEPDATGRDLGELARFALSG